MTPWEGCDLSCGAAHRDSARLRDVPNLECPDCGSYLFLESLTCQQCGSAVAFHLASRSFHVLPDDPVQEVEIGGVTWRPCSNRVWGCNWLVSDQVASAKCFSCRLTRRRPDLDDTVALEMLATTASAKRRLVVQLCDLGLPITPYYEQEGGLAFDFLSSHSSGRPVTIGHANGVVTIDLAESLDAHREHLRVQLGEPYRTMLGHLRHEVGHYFQGVLIHTDQEWAECRDLFGDERESYQEALQRHYRNGAPKGWEEDYISEYATMHPWEDFAECFAHYLHMTGTLSTAAYAGMVLDTERNGDLLPRDVAPLRSYASSEARVLLRDWIVLSTFFNQVNRSMGQQDLYPFRITRPVANKLAYMHRLITHAQGDGLPVAECSVSD